MNYPLIQNKYYTQNKICIEKRIAITIKKINSNYRNKRKKLISQLKQLYNI